MAYKPGLKFVHLRDYGLVKPPENYDLLLRLIPRKHTQIRAYINALKYENRRLLIWYNRIPMLMKKFKEAEMEISRLEREIKQYQNRVIKYVQTGGKRKPRREEAEYHPRGENSFL